MSKRGKIVKRYKEVTEDFLAIVTDMGKMEPEDVQWIFHKLKKHQLAFKNKIHKLEEAFEKINNHGEKKDQPEG